MFYLWISNPVMYDLDGKKTAKLLKKGVQRNPRWQLRNGCYGKVTTIQVSANPNRKKA